MKRFIILVMVLTLMMTVFGGCGDKEGANSTASNSSQSIDDSIFSLNNIAFVDADGEAVYCIVRPDGNSEATKSASLVFQEMKGALGVKMKNMLDNEDGTDKYEILVGNTNRPESQQALQYLYDNNYGRYNDYIICTIGKKIVICGITDEAVTAATEYFVANYIKKEGIEGGIKYINATKGEFTDITINGANIGEFTIARDNTWCSWLIQEEIRKIQEMLKEKTGYVVELVDDDEASEFEYEISIGNTNRPAVASMTGHSHEEYEIKISGKKVYILGGSSHAVQVAVTEFGKMLEKGTVTDADTKAGTYLETVAKYDTETYYTLKWGDDFDNPELDRSKWSIQSYHDPGSVGPVHGIVNEHTFEISGGNVIMRGFPNDEGGYTYCEAISSRGIMFYNRGYMEMRARIPGAKGAYTSFWGSSPSGGDRLEIDIFESLGSAQTIRANVHGWRSDGSHGSLDSAKPVSRDYRLREGNYFDQYHVYSLLWDNTQITCMFDGQVYFTQPMDDYCIDKYICVLAGFNVGRKDRTPPDASIEWPLEYRIDYINLYQIDGQNIMYN